MDYTCRSCDNLNWYFKEEEIPLILVTCFNKGTHKHIFLTISFFVLYEKLIGNIKTISSSLF